MERSGRPVLIAVVVVLVILAAAAIAALSWYDGTTYVKSDSGQVSAPMAPVGSLAAGTLSGWSVQVGEAVTEGQVLGTVAPAGAAAGKASALDIRAPFAGTVIEADAVVGQTVAPGTPLAYVAKLSEPTVTAYVKESDIRHVQVGQPADVYVDALPGTTLSGTVKSITLGTASTFSVLPAPAPSGSVTKVTQYIPVTVALSGGTDKVLPGESASVRIHIR